MMGKARRRAGAQFSRLDFWYSNLREDFVNKLSERLRVMHFATAIREIRVSIREV